MKKQKIIIFAMGSGETSHAYAIGKYLSLKNYSVFLTIKKQDNANFVSDQKLQFPLFITKAPEDLKKLANNIKPNIIIFCNSKSFRKEKSFIFAEKSPFKGIITITVDSNWLFDSKSKNYPFIQWADKYLVNLPEAVFKNGLKENGGYFNIQKSILKNITPIGFIPSYNKISEGKIDQARKSLGIAKNEKLIFCYFSGVGATNRSWIVYNLISALKKIKNANRIKVLLVGDYTHLNMKIIDSYGWFIKYSLHDIENFYTLLSSSDLVFQHQGLATLAQAISAQIPVIANVRIYKGEEFPGLHPAEVLPFSKLGLCKMFYKSSRKIDISKSINDLLFDEEKIKKMRFVQKDYFEKGEENLYRIIKNI